MLTAKPQLNLANAKEYFREHLCVGDYYAEGQKVSGEWFGVGAAKLSLEGIVTGKDFLRLCEGLHPRTGERLTQRLNSSRRDSEGRTVANRRVFYDFTLSPPKSVSVVALLQDDRILAVHEQSVRHAMIELEKFAGARVRKAGQHGERVTGNVVAAAFRHDTSRELDPHLHTHCVVLNATFDQAEARWKALEVHGMYRAQKFAENLYYHELSKGLRALGYAIENHARGFEIKGVPASVVACFSKRHQQIDAEAEKQLRREGGDRNAVRRRLAQEARRRKLKDSTAQRLRPSWIKQLDPEQKAALTALCSVKSPRAASADVPGIVAWADAQLFERRSVAPDYELMATALARGRGENFDLAALRDAVAARGYIREDGTQNITSREVLLCELEVVLAAKNGRGQHESLSPGYRPTAGLSPEQRMAVEKILASRDFVTLFRGGAGTGKSFALKEVERDLIAAHRPVVVLAPQRQQVSDLRADGLAAETLASFLQTKELPRNAVVIVDEAGQIGGRQLRDLIRILHAHAGRLVLSGDTRQHGAVAASDALRAIERYAGLKPAVIRQIRRQDPKLGSSAKERNFIRQYRAAVRAAAKGDVVKSFDRLDQLGCLREVEPSGRRDALARDYLAAVGRRETALVVAQTRDEVRGVNEAVRTALVATGKLGMGRMLQTYQPIDLGDAEKCDPRFYQPGQRAFFLKRYGRFAKADLCEVTGANERGVVIVKDGRRSTLSYRYTDRIVVASSVDLPLARGDRLQLKFNGKSVEGAPLNNGELVTVRHVRRDGALVVAGDDGTRKTLTPAQRLFVRGYAVTSYGSQGKTVDTVLFADAASKAATSANQWYVAISRGRKRVVVFTSDKAELRANIQRAGERALALDLKPNEVESAHQHPAWLRRAWVNIERVKRHRFLQSLRPQSQRAQRVRV